jgi:hypothetical protein
VIALVLMFAAAQSLAEPSLQPIAYLVGHCWSGDAPGDDGTDTHCFEAVYGGHHVRDRHTVIVDGKEVYAGEALYSAERGAITFTYWNSMGGVGHGAASASGAELHFSGQMRPSPSSKNRPDECHVARNS